MFWRRKVCHLSLTKPTIPFGKLSQKPSRLYSVPKVIIKNKFNEIFIIVSLHLHNWSSSWFQVVHMQGIPIHVICDGTCNAYIINLFVYPLLYVTDLLSHYLFLSFSWQQPVQLVNWWTLMCGATSKSAWKSLVSPRTLQKR